MTFFVNTFRKEGKMTKLIPYKGLTIENHLSGWFTCFMLGHGTLKADTLDGIKELINKELCKTKTK